MKWNLSYSISVSLCAVLLSGCLQDKAAPIEFHEEFHGRDATYDRTGNPMPRYSDQNRATLPEEIAPKYVEKEQQHYGVDAPVAPIASSTLPPVDESVTIEQPGASRMVDVNTVGNVAEPETHIAEKQENVVKEVDRNLLPQGWARTPQQQTEPSPQEQERRADIERMTRMAEEELQQAGPDVDERVPTDGVVQEPAATSQVTPVAPQIVAREIIAEEIPAASNSVRVEPNMDASPEFVWPLRGRLLQDFNASGEQGIAIAGRKGEPVRASADGVIAHVGEDVEQYGRIIIIQHEKGYVTTYGHLSDSVVRKGEDVMQGQLIGFVGKSGGVSSARLHFSLRSDVRSLDPAVMIPTSLE